MSHVQFKTDFPIALQVFNKKLKIIIREVGRFRFSKSVKSMTS